MTELCQTQQERDGSYVANLVKKAPDDKSDCVFIGIIIIITIVFCNSILPQSTWRCCCKKKTIPGCPCLQHVMWVAIKIAGELSWRGRSDNGFTFGTRTTSFLLFSERFYTETMNKVAPEGKRQRMFQLHLWFDEPPTGSCHHGDWS